MIPIDVQSGDYELLVGFYDPTSNYARLPLHSEKDHFQARSDQALALITIQIQD